MKPHILTLGPCLFNWKVNDWRDFYYKIADEAAVDEVYIGEVVCQKRYPFFEVAFDDVIKRLETAGKKVHISTFSLMLGDLEVKTTYKIKDRFAHSNLIEVNDIGALGVIDKGAPFIIGPTINVYHSGTLEILRAQGALRCCFPYEIDLESLQTMSKDVPNIEKEFLAFGRMPLAIAARCYHARIHGTSKDDCRYVCEQDYNGKTISTLTDENFLVVNGTQTMSFGYNNLLRDLDKLIAAGINIFRISPHHLDMVEVINIFDKVLNKKLEAKEGFHILEQLLEPDDHFVNGFLYGKEGRIYQPPY